MKIVCCSNIPYASEAFSTLGDTLIKDGRDIASRDVSDASILIVRSTTKVGRDLLAGSSVKFVATATIGVEHMDTAWLASRGIQWSSAQGCNANSVSEYVAAALLCLANRHGFALAGKTIGVVGLGTVGSIVARKTLALGMRVLRNDPPLERRQQTSLRPAARDYGGQATRNPQPTTNSSFVSLGQILSESDILTLHVPLTNEGPDATYHLADDKFFARMKPGCVFFNTSRGAIASTRALLAAIEAGQVGHAVIDTWEDEPAYSRELLDRADIGTPHIAGYSFDGKVMGTLMAYRQTCEFLGVEPVWNLDNLLPPPAVPEIALDRQASASSISRRNEEAALWEIVRKVYDIEADDRRMRESCLADDKERAANFDRLRKNYPQRREFQFTRVIAKGASSSLAAKIAGLGFRLA